MVVAAAVVVVELWIPHAGVVASIATAVDDRGQPCCPCLREQWQHEYDHGWLVVVVPVVVPASTVVLPCDDPFPCSTWTGCDESGANWKRRRHDLREHWQWRHVVAVAVVFVVLPCIDDILRPKQIDVVAPAVAVVDDDVVEHVPALRRDDDLSERPVPKDGWDGR